MFYTPWPNPGSQSGLCQLLGDGARRSSQLGSTLRPGQASSHSYLGTSFSLALAATFPLSWPLGLCHGKILQGGEARERRTLGKKIEHCHQATRWGRGYCVTEVRQGRGLSQEGHSLWVRAAGWGRRWLRWKCDVLNLGWAPQRCPFVTSLPACSTTLGLGVEHWPGLDFRARFQWGDEPRGPF